jgi:hypothetical protein
MIVQFQERVLAAGHAVHVKQRNQRTAQYVSEEGDMGFDVCRHDRDMVDAGRVLVHVVVPLSALVLTGLHRGPEPVEGLSFTCLENQPFDKLRDAD